MSPLLAIFHNNNQPPRAGVPANCMCTFVAAAIRHHPVPQRYNYELVSTLRNPEKTRRDPLKRTAAAYTLLVGLTAVMIGLYVGEFKIILQILSNYTVLLP
jgi:hypothetical protein